MTRLDERTLANLEVVLENTCKGLPNGGDHESRKYIARKLLQSAEQGNHTLGVLGAVAQSALQALSKRRSA
jgi:hypothetical protein